MILIINQIYITTNMMRFVAFSCAAVAAMCFASCNKNEQAPVIPDRPVKITVSVSGPRYSETKATSVTYSNESKVNNVQIYVFNNGDLENYISVDNQKTVEISATSGERTIWALVNAPQFSNISTVDQLKARTSDLADNAVNGFVMAGSATQVLADGTDVPVTVRRIVSRIAVQKITPQFTFSRESYVMEIQGIYLINVVGNATYDGEFIASGVWYNKLGHVIPEGSSVGECDDLLFDSPLATIQNGHPYEVEHVFYPYPNPTATSGSYPSSWSARRSMLVVEVKILTSGGSGTLPVNAIGYYPVELPVLERNKSYIIEEIILTKNPGSTPYVPLDDDAVTATISVADWAGPENLGTQYL